MLRFRSFLVSGLLLLLVAGTASASVTLRLTLPELTDSSVAVVRGRVVAIDSAWDRPGGTIYTYIEIRINDVLKGEAPRRITLKQLGGTVGDMSLVVQGQSEWTRREEVVLFLGVRPRDLTLDTSTLWQGKWTVERDPETGDEQVVRFAGRDESGEPIDREQMALADLEAAARVQSRTSRSVPTGIVFNPPEAPPTR